MLTMAIEEPNEDTSIRIEAALETTEDGLDNSALGTSVNSLGGKKPKKRVKKVKKKKEKPS